MKFYEITYILEDEQYKRLSQLAERYEKIKGWNEKEMLQFAVNATAKTDIDDKVRFLETQIIQFEKEWQELEAKKSGQKRGYISDDEREKCRKVVNAFAKELDDIEIIVTEAGKYGFVKLMDYEFPYGFDSAMTYTGSLELFLDLWDEWFETQLLRLTKNTPMAEMDYEDMFKCLSKDKQQELMAKREYFAKKAEIHTL